MKSTCLLIALTLGVVFSSVAQHRLNDSTVLTSDSVSLYLKVSGKGTPCIFVHGGPGAWSRSFEALGGNVLEKHLSMYYFDQRGCGRSQEPANKDYSLGRMIEDIENIRILSGSDQVYLVAHSFGGVLAFNYAKKYPTHVKGLILLNATLGVNNSLLSQIRYMDQLLDSHTVVKNDEVILQDFITVKTALNKKQLGYKLLSDNKSTVEKLDSIDNYPRTYSFAGYALSRQEFLADYTKETAAVDIPVLVIAGSADYSIGPDHYKLFHFPHQQTKVIKGGHVLYYEKNKEFADAVFRFVK
jgi:proline iminopeptidase